MQDGRVWDIRGRARLEGVKIGHAKGESTPNPDTSGCAKRRLKDMLKTAPIFIALGAKVRLLLGLSASFPLAKSTPVHRMASNRLLASTPLTFELPSSLIARIHDCRGRLGLKSASEVVRRALAGFDFAGFKTPAREQCQISVRLAPDQKRALFKAARQKKVSAGELLRAAIEALSTGKNGVQSAGPASGRKAGKKTAARRK